MQSKKRRPRCVAEPIPKRIAVLLPNLKFGGAERAALNLAKGFKDIGIQVEILLMSREGELLPEAERDFQVVDLECDRTYKLPGKLLNYLVMQRPDVLVSSFWKLNLCSCLARALVPRTKLVLWEHSHPSRSRNSPRWLYSPSASMLYGLSTKVVAVSTGVYRDIDRWTFGLRRKLVVIFNPIVPPEPHILQRRRRPDSKQVIWVGRLDHPKNPGLLLDAFALLPGSCKANLVFVGEGRLRPELEQRCKFLDMEDRVSFLGFRPNPYEEMAASDLLVLSSDREGLGNVIVEALYCGLRVVSTDCGEGIQDILLDDRYGTTVPCRDKVSMAEAIADELQAHHDAQTQVHGAQRFLPEVIVRQFLAAAGVP